MHEYMSVSCYCITNINTTSLYFHSLFISLLISFSGFPVPSLEIFSHVSRLLSIHQFANSFTSLSVIFPTIVECNCQLPKRERETEREGENKPFADGLQTLHSIAILIHIPIPRSRLHSKSFSSELAIGQVRWQLPKLSKLLAELVGNNFLCATWQPYGRFRTFYWHLAVSLAVQR